MGEIVKYQNNMNRLKFKGFTQTDMNLFMGICSQMKEKNTKKIVLSFSQIKDLVRYDEKKKGVDEFISDLKRMNEHLMSVNCEIITDSEISMFILFPTFKINLSNETLTVAVNEEFTWLLNEMRNYTAFELEEFINLNGKYAKILYRLLKQWKTQGQYIFHNLEEFRELMDIPITYSNKLMIQKCVNVAVEEIGKLDKSFQDFKCEPIYARKRGKPLDKLMFTWKPEKAVQTQENQLKGQETFTDVQSFDEYMKGYQGEDKPSPVAIKIAQDIEKGRKKATPKKNSFNDFQQRSYDYDELEKMLLTTNPN